VTSDVVTSRIKKAVKLRLHKPLRGNVWNHIM
jgi:hypothetical protein